MIRLSVVICCYNSAERLPSTLRHLTAQDADPDTWEVIVVDNASTDNTAEIAGRCWTVGVPIRVIREQKPGQIHARMRGLAEASGEFICFVDDDNWLNGSWVRKVCEIMTEHPAIGVLGGRGETVSDTALPDWFGKVQRAYAVGTQSSNSGDVTDYVGSLWGAGMTIRRSAWQQIMRAGFQPFLEGRKGSLLTSGDDTEIVLALKCAGWRWWYDDCLVFQHYIPETRLRWAYVRRMYRGFGAASPLTQLYRNPGSRIGRSYSAANLILLSLYHWVHSALRIATLVATAPWAMLRKTEGDMDVLALEYAWGRLTTFLFSPSRFARSRVKFDSFVRRLEENRT